MARQRVERAEVQAFGEDTAAPTAAVAAKRPQEWDYTKRNAQTVYLCLQTQGHCHYV